MTLLNKHLLNGAQGVWWWTMGLQTDQKKIACIPVVDSFWYLAKLIQLCRV